MEKVTLRIKVQQVICNELLRLYQLANEKSLTFEKLSVITGLTIGNLRRIFSYRYCPNVFVYYVLKFAIEDYEA